MGPTTENTLRPWTGRLLAGLEAGVLAGLLMAGWLMMESARRNHSAWSASNTVSTVVLGRYGLAPGFGLATVSGLSLQIMAAGIHGMLFAMILPPTARPFWAANAGVLFSLLSYCLLFLWAMARWAPLFAQRASRPAWLGGYFLFGVILGLYPDFARSLRQEKSNPQIT